MIEGSPITVCRRCGAAYSQVVMGACLECDRADWELCKLIESENFIRMSGKEHIGDAADMTRTVNRE